MSYKVLGSSSPTGATNTEMYTVPAGGQAVVSSLTVCNRSSTAEAFRVAVHPTGSLASANYIYYDTEVQGNSTFVFTGGITMAAGDVLMVHATNGNLSFNLFGKEIT